MRFRTVWNGLKRFEWLLQNANNRYQPQKLLLRVVVGKLFLPLITDSLLVNRLLQLCFFFFFRFVIIINVHCFVFCQWFVFSYCHVFWLTGFFFLKRKIFGLFGSTSITRLYYYCLSFDFQVFTFGKINIYDFIFDTG